MKDKFRFRQKDVAGLKFNTGQSKIHKKLQVRLRLVIIGKRFTKSTIYNLYFLVTLGEK